MPYTETRICAVSSHGVCIQMLSLCQFKRNHMEKKKTTHASYEYFKQKSLNRLMWGDGGRARLVFGHCLEIGQRKGSGVIFATSPRFPACLERNTSSGKCLK